MLFIYFAAAAADCRRFSLFCHGHAAHHVIVTALDATLMLTLRYDAMLSLLLRHMLPPCRLLPLMFAAMLLIRRCAMAAMLFDALLPCRHAAAACHMLLRRCCCHCCFTPDADTLLATLISCHIRLRYMAPSYAPCCAAYAVDASRHTMPFSLLLMR